jgi:hypothetical protein
LSDKDFQYIENKNNYSQYSEIENHNLLVFLDSSLGYEAIARNIKICCFSIRGSVLGIEKNDMNFGWPGKFDNSGFFWTNKKNFNQFEMIANQVYDISQKEWSIKIQNLSSELMNYSKQNQIFFDYLNENDVRVKLKPKNKDD